MNVNRHWKQEKCLQQTVMAWLSYLISEESQGLLQLTDGTEHREELNVYGNQDDSEEVRPPLKTPRIVWTKIKGCWNTVHVCCGLLRCCGNNQSSSQHMRKRQCLISSQVKELHFNRRVCRLFVSCYTFPIPFPVQLPIFILIIHLH